MKTPPPWQPQFEFVERLVAGILELVFRLDSNARLRGRNKLHADSLALDGVAGAERRHATGRPENRNRGKRRKGETRMNSKAQNN